MPSAADGRLVAFLGPSLPAAEALKIVPEAELWPPVCQGDLWTAVERSKPAAVLIVDGEFGQSLSVWHKEILNALQRGIRVVGASSMGALRAAEMDRFGMEGVGAIYADYRDGRLLADADVALLHADAQDGYRPLTWPLVNVRATLRALREQLELTDELAAAVLAAAERLHFSERTGRAVARELSREGMPARRAEQLAELLAGAYVDQKALDAIAGFQHLAQLHLIPPPARETPLHRDGRGFQPLLWSDVAISRRAGSLRRYQLVADAALHHPDYEALAERAANRYLVSILAQDMGVEPSAAEIDEQRALILGRLGLTEDAIADWLVANDLDETGFADLVAQEARCTRMRRWLLATRLYERNRRMVIEQLQLEGEYARAADAAAHRRVMADHRLTPPYPATDEALRELLIRQMAISGWRPRGDLAKCADEQGFDTQASLLVALSDSAAANEELQERRRRVAKALGLDGSASPRAGAATPTGAAATPTGAARARALLEAHQVTQVIVTALELGVPAALADGPRSAPELATVTGTRTRLLERLLLALEAVRIVARQGNGWVLTGDGLALTGVALGGEDGLATYAEYLRTAIFSAWAGLAGIIRGAEPPPYPMDELADGAVAAITQDLDHADALITAVELPQCARVADIGGGLGGLVRRLVESRPDLSVALVELPATADRAAAQLRRAELIGRVEVIPYVGEKQLTAPVDRCLLTRVIVTLDDSAATRLLSFAARSLARGGRIEILDLEADGTASAAFADLLNLARSGGAVRSRAEWQALARRAGLRIAARQQLAAPFVLLSLEPVVAPTARGQALAAAQTAQTAQAAHPADAAQTAQEAADAAQTRLAARRAL